LIAWRKTGATVLPEKIIRRLIMLRQQLLFSSHAGGFYFVGMLVTNVVYK